MSSSKRQFTILKQISKLIPRNLVCRLAKKHGVDKQSRSITPWSHTLSLMYAQLSHAMSLNDICDALKNHKGSFRDIRDAEPISRNGFSNANRTRNPKMAEDLFWNLFEQLKKNSPSFGYSSKPQKSGVPHRFKRAISAVDSSTIKLFANSLDWAKHRRRKAAAKLHLRLDLQTFLPQFIIVKAANSHDSTEAKEVCAGIKAGEIVVFDKAYVDFKHLNHLDNREVFWVTRSKDNMTYKSMGQHTNPKGKVCQDIKIKLTGNNTKSHYQKELRLVEIEVEVNGVIKKMSFITNNFEWSPNSIADLYKSRWGIEVFFKEIKQTLQISDFLGYNENAVQWQVWTALTVYILLRYIAHIKQWKFSFPRLFTVIRSVLWTKVDLDKVIESCGTASDPKKIRGAPEQAFLPGLVFS